MVIGVGRQKYCRRFAVFITVVGEATSGSPTERNIKEACPDQNEEETRVGIG